MAPFSQRAAASQQKDVSRSGDSTGRLEMDFQRDRGLVLACLNLAIDTSDEWKRAALASRAGMSEPQYSKVTNGSNDTKALHQVIDTMPHDLFVDFMVRLGRARGVRVVERETSELTEELYDSLHRFVSVAKLLLIRRPTPMKAKLSE